MGPLKPAALVPRPRSQRFATIVSDFIEINVQAGIAFDIATGLGRQVGGYLVVWQSAPCSLSVVNPAADTRRTLRLLPSATATLRIVLL